jgi:hypothetical protein
MNDGFAVTNRNRLRRRHERGHYDRETVYAILDAAMVCHNRLRHRRAAVLHADLVLA